MSSSFLRSIVGISPHVEVLFRKLYWNNVKILRRFKPKASISSKKKVSISFDKILDILKFNGIGTGDLLILHSSFGALKPSGKSPDQIIDALIKLLGDDGTLAMPVIRVFDNEPNVYEILKVNLQKIKCTYDVAFSPIWTGVLPITLSKRKNVVISRFPLNPMAAIGKLAKPMMENNLTGDILLPHGENSSWKFCLDHQAFIVGIGVDLAHSLTMLRTYEECNFSSWPVKNWYNERQYNIVDNEFVTSVKVLERKPHWGMLYLLQINMRKDLIKNKILNTFVVDGVPVEIINSQKLYAYFKERNLSQKGYPYFIPKRYLK